MKPIKVVKSDVIAIMTKNREAHHDLYLKAMDGYRVLVEEDVKQMLEEIMNRQRRVFRVRISAELEDMPVDRTKDYDDVIGMLEMSVDDVIELEHADYRRFVLDKWDWSDLVRSTNVKYSNG